jgi:hypothetical protein
MNSERQIVPGISVSPSGQTKIDPALRDVIVDLAIDLESATKLPVNIEHVVAAIRLAARKHKIEPTKQITAADPALVDILVPHLRTVFSLLKRHRGDNVSKDD